MSLLGTTSKGNINTVLKSPIILAFEVILNCFPFLTKDISRRHVAASGFGAGRQEASPVIIRVDGSRLLQRMDGFGASCVVGFEALERGSFDQVVPMGVT